MGLLLISLWTVLTNVLEWDEKGVEVLGKIKGGSSLPFGWPIYKKTMKYFNFTVSNHLSLSIQVLAQTGMCLCSFQQHSSVRWWVS